MFYQIKDKIKGKPKAKRSSKWRKVRKEHLKENPRCAVCECKRKREVHHKKPFHLFPELELVKTNMMTLCENKKYGIVCHLLIGHLGNYKRYNPLVDEDSKIWNEKIKGRSLLELKETKQ